MISRQAVSMRLLEVYVSIEGFPEPERKKISDLALEILQGSHRQTVLNIFNSDPRPVKERSIVPAVKAYRELTGTGLKDAKEAVEDILWNVYPELRR